MTPAEIECLDRHAAFFRSEDFIKKFAAIRRYMRDAENADRLADENDMAKVLGIHPSAVRLLYAFVDAFDASEVLIDTADLLEAKPAGALN